MQNENNNKNNSIDIDVYGKISNSEEERFSDVEDNKDSQKGSQEGDKEYLKENEDTHLEGQFSAEKTENARAQAENGDKAAEKAAESASGQAESSREKGEDSCSEADADSRESDSDEIKTVGDSVEYVWNSSERGRESCYAIPVADAESEKKKVKKAGRKRSGLKAALVVLVCALLSMSLVGGTMIGYLIARGEESSNEEEAPAKEEQQPSDTIEMVKNDGSVNVTIGSTGKTDLTKSEVVTLVADAVVEITTSVVQTNPYYGNYVTSGAGSGVVITQSDEYAYIVTNYHVVDGASSASVILTDGTKIDAEYLDGDANYDIAMIRIKTSKKFPKIVCGSSASLKVGEEVLAIGNPLGQLGGTVTDGIISALNREVVIDNVKMTLLQTSAAVNPGNSGGGLFNMAGELIGIVNAKKSAEGIEGLGFAIPIDIVYNKLVEIIENGYIHGRASLGVETEYVTRAVEAFSKYSISNTGVYVTSSSIDSVRTRDYLYAINGQRVIDGSTYAAIISSLKIGDKVELTLWRIDRSSVVEVKVEVTVVEYVPSGIFG